MLIDLHTYSRASGGASVDNVVSAARAAGLDAVLFADREASAEVARGIARGTFGDFRVFVGVELSTRGGDAILVLPQIDPYLTREEWRELIAFGRPTLEDVVNYAEREGGVVLLAHPYDRDRKLSPRDRMFVHQRLSGIEVGSNGSHPSSNAVALEAVGYSGVPAFGGSAATGVQANEPRWATLLSGTPTNHAELVELLKAGNFWAVEIYPPGVSPRIARDDRGPRRDDRGPRPEGGDRGPRRDDRGPRPEGGDRGPRRDDRGPRPEGGDRGPRRDDRGPRP